MIHKKRLEQEDEEKKEDKKYLTNETLFEYLLAINFGINTQKDLFKVRKVSLYADRHKQSSFTQIQPVIGANLFKLKKPQLIKVSTEHRQYNQKTYLINWEKILTILKGIITKEVQDIEEILKSEEENHKNGIGNESRVNELLNRFQQHGHSFDKNVVEKLIDPKGERRFIVGIVNNLKINNSIISTFLSYYWSQIYKNKRYYNLTLKASLLYFFRGISLLKNQSAPGWQIQNEEVDELIDLIITAQIIAKYNSDFYLVADAYGAFLKGDLA
ncbi:MAG: hypothetical protein V1859_06530 [archaeon]